MPKPRVLNLMIGGLIVPLPTDPENPTTVTLVDEEGRILWLADVYSDRTGIGNWPDGEEWIGCNLDHDDHDHKEN